MAEVVKKKVPSAAFDIEAFTNTFAETQALREERQKQERAAMDAEIEAQRQMTDVTNQSLEVKQGYLEGITPLVKESQRIAAASQRQMDLQSSGSFLDQLQAMEDAMLNPRLYTSEGRAKLRAEINAQASTLATVAEAQQNVLSTEMDLVKMGLANRQAGLKKASLAEAQKMEAVKAESERRKTIISGLQENATAQSLLMDQMTPEELTAAKAEAVKNNGKVDVSGFPLSSATIDAEIAKRTSIQYDLQAKNMAIANNNKKMIADANERVLAGLNTDQLNGILQGKPIEITFAGGEKQTLTLADFDLAQVKSHYESKQKAFSDMMQQNYDSIMYGDPRGDITERIEKMDSLIKNTPAGTPEHERAKRRKADLQAHYDAIADGEERIQGTDSPQLRTIYNATARTMVENVKKQDQQDAKDLESAAKRMGRGDKDLTVTAGEFITGQPISQQPVVDYVTRKAANNEDVSAMLGPEGSRLFKRNYDQAIAAYRNAQGGLNSALLGGDKIREKEYKQEVAYQALMTTVNQMSQDHVTRFIGLQAELNLNGDKDIAQNPIANVRDSMGRKLFTPESFLGFVKKADDAAITDLKSAQEYKDKLTDADIAQLLSGQSVQRDGFAVDAEMFRQQLNARQNVQLLFALDNTRPGLAKEYVDWWSTKGPSYSKDYLNQNITSGQNLPDAAIKSMSTDIVNTAMQEYAAGLNNTFWQYKGEQQKQRQDWVSYDLEPANRQAALLQFTPGLSNEEKTTIYRFGIKPLLEQAKKQGLDFEQTNILIEDAFESPDLKVPGFKENAALKKAMGKMMPMRGEVRTQLQALTDSPWLYGNNQGLADSIWDSLGATDWKREAQKGLQGGFGELGGIGTSVEANPRGINLGITGSYDKWLKNETVTRPYDWYRNLIIEGQQQQQDLNQDQTGGM